MLKRVVTVIMVMGMFLTGGMASAMDFGSSKVLTDTAGVKYEIAGENLMIIIVGSKKTLAKDGNYTFTDGSKLTVKGGKIVSKTTAQPVKVPAAAVPAATVPVQPKTETPKSPSAPAAAADKQQIKQADTLKQQTQPVKVPAAAVPAATAPAHTKTSVIKIDDKFTKQQFDALPDEQELEIKGKRMTKRQFKADLERRRQEVKTKMTTMKKDQGDNEQFMRQQEAEIKARNDKVVVEFKALKTNSEAKPQKMEAIKSKIDEFNRLTQNASPAEQALVEQKLRDITLDLQQLK